MRHLESGFQLVSLVLLQFYVRLNRTLHSLKLFRLSFSHEPPDRIFLEFIEVKVTIS